METSFWISVIFTCFFPPRCPGPALRGAPFACSCVQISRTEVLARRDKAKRPSQLSPQACPNTLSRAMRYLAPICKLLPRRLRQRAVRRVGGRLLRLLSRTGHRSPRSRWPAGSARAKQKGCYWHCRLSFCWRSRMATEDFARDRHWRSHGGGGGRARPAPFRGECWLDPGSKSNLH